VYCPDCGAENSRSQKYCTRCGTNLIAIDRAREIVSEMRANVSSPPVAPSSILRIVALISAIGFIATTSGTVALMHVGGPTPLFFALGGFTALVMICRYLLQMINPQARTGMGRQAPPAPAATPVVGGATNRALGGAPTPYHSIIEEPTQQFETERRAK
jgi:zinc ribbon protein